MSYQFKTVPFEHQLRAFNLSKDLDVFALLMEQGTGKSKVVVDTAGYMWGKGRIQALLIVAPNGVHRNWILNELPAHLPDYVDYRAAWYSSNMKAKERKQLDLLFEQGAFLRVLAVNVEAVATPKANKLVNDFLLLFRSLMVIDESSRIKNMSAQRTKCLIKLGKRAQYRRILTGTPVTNSPLDLYAQFRFLDDDILETTSFYAFKARYAELVDPNSALMRSIMARSQARFAPQIVASNPDGTPKYKNLEELRLKIAPYSFRVLKSECLDLPDKLYTRTYCELSSAHQTIYKRLKEEAKLEMQGETTKVAKLQLAMRMQQVAHGYLPDGNGGVERIYAKPLDNPRIQALIDIVEDIDTPVLIWARFIAEIEDIVQALQTAFPDRKTVAYYGAVSGDDRVAAVQGVQANQVRFFVGQPKSGGIGLTLTAASTVIYYSNDFSLEDRLQSEDRAHRIGQTKNVTYYDIEAVDTNDKKVIDSLRMKKDIANMITGDATEWL